MAELGEIVVVERARQLTNHERLPRRRLRSLGRPAGRMLDQELDECLPALPAIDATAQLWIECDGARREPLPLPATDAPHAAEARAS